MPCSGATQSSTMGERKGNDSSMEVLPRFVRVPDDLRLLSDISNLVSLL